MVLYCAYLFIKNYIYFFILIINKYTQDIQFKDTGNTPTILNLTNSSKLQLKFILPWTNHIYIEYDLVVKWPPVLIKNEPLLIKETTEIQVPSTPTTQPTPAPSQSPDNCLNIHYSVVVKG